MSTTSLIIEYLVSGILMLIAILFFFFGLYPDDVLYFLSGFKDFGDFSIIIVACFTAICYALGVMSEIIARIIFEYTLHMPIAKWRLTNYLDRHRENLYLSPLLKDFHPKVFDNLKGRINFAWRLKKAGSYIGRMRFYVLMHSPELYSEIEGQISKMRLIRVLTLVEIILLLGVIFQLKNTPLPILYTLRNVIIITTVASIIAVASRLSRYNRSVERSYQVLVFNNDSTNLEGR